jgi:hypothetical protein
MHRHSKEREYTPHILVTHTHTHTYIDTYAGTDACADTAESGSTRTTFWSYTHTRTQETNAQTQQQGAEAHAPHSTLAAAAMTGRKFLRWGLIIILLG